MTNYNGKLIRIDNTGDSAELVTQLDTNGSAAVVLSLDLGDIKIGDYVVGDGYFQGTKSAAYNIGIISQLTLGTSPTDTGAEISEANGSSILASANHGVYRASDTAQITNTSRRYLNLVARSYSSAGSDPVSIDQDYGSLSYQLYRDPATFFEIKPTLTVEIP